MYLDFKLLQLCGGEGICLANDRDNVDKIVKLLHKLNVQRLQSKEREREKEMSQS